MEHPIFSKATFSVKDFLDKAIENRGKRFSRRQVQYLVNRAKCEYMSIVGSDDGWIDILQNEVKHWKSNLTII